MKTKTDKYQDTYLKTSDHRILVEHIQKDSDLGLLFISDHICVDQHATHIIREINLKFLKILLKSGLFVIDELKDFKWKDHLSQDDLKSIINLIESDYKAGLFHDSDLHDDIFEHFDVVLAEVYVELIEPSVLDEP